VSPPTPAQLIVVAGTGTEVGKTWVGAHLVRELRRRGHEVQARKPAQSFEPDDPAEGTDAALLGAATGEAPTTVCPAHRWYPTAMAPPMAADALGRAPIHLAELVAELASSWGPTPAPIGLVELAGGIWSPHAHDGDGLELTAALAPAHIVLVADAGLGTLNSIRPAVAALTPIAPVTTLLNRYDDAVELRRRNRAWLVDTYGIAVVTALSDLADTLGG
jgi:dethiobiotin synthetase